MKTIKEWLEMLNEPERSEALDNCDNDYPYTGHAECESLYDSLSDGFIYYKTPQGHNYWQKIYNSLKNNTYKFNNENKLHS